MESRLEWEQPPVVWEWKKREVWTLFRHFWVMLSKAVWGLWCLVVLPVAYFWGNVIYPVEDFGRWFGNLALVGLFSPSLFMVLVLLIQAQEMLRMFGRRGRRYELSSKGALRRDWQNPLGARWKEIEEYRFKDHAGVPGIRVLEFKLKPLKRGPVQLERVWCEFEFDPLVTSESEIEAVFRHYLGIARGLGGH